MANVIEVLIQARSSGGKAIATTEAQLRGLQATAGRMAGALTQAVSGSTAMTGTLTEMGAAAGPAGMAIAAVAASVVGLGVAIYKSAEGLTEQVEQLQRLSNQTGVSTQNLQVLQRIMQESGGDAGTLTQAFSFLNRAIAENNPMLRALGINTRDTFAAFMQLATILSQTKDTANATAIAQELLGRGGKDLLGTVSELVKKFPEMSAELEALGLTFSDDTISALNAVDTKLDDAQRRWDAFFNNIKIKSAPVAGWLADIISPPATQSGPMAGLDAAQQERLNASARSAVQMPKDFILALPTFEAMDSAFVSSAHAAQQTADAVAAAALRAKEQADAQKKAADEAERNAAALRRSAQAVRDEVAALASAYGTQSDAKLRRTGPRGLLQPTEKATAPSAEEVERMRVKTFSTELMAVLDQWSEFSDEVLAGAAVLDSALQTVQQGLQQGFATVFAQMISGAQSFSQAMQSIFRSMVNAIIGELARLAAYAVIKTLLNIATGGAGDLVNIPKEVAANSLASTASAASMSQSVTNVTINALDARSVLQQSMSPSGALRLTNLRMAELAAVA